MTSDERRIRKLNLKAPSETSAGRGAILVEDAFRTASLPDPGARLLVVRCLSLGSIRSDRSPASIALAIEERLRLLSSTAFYALDPSASRKAVVYFQNEAEPYIRLAARLAAGQSTDAWFWPLAVRCFRPGMSRDEALRAVLSESQKTAAGTAVVVEMVRALVRSGAVDRLFEALRWQEGPELLHSIGCSMAEPPRQTSEPSREATAAEIVEWPELVHRWTARWGVDDARSVWLAALSLIATHPARALDPHLAVRALRLILRIATTETPRNPERKRAPLERTTEVLIRERAASPATVEDAGRAVTSHEDDSIAALELRHPGPAVKQPVESIGSYESHGSHIDSIEAELGAQNVEPPLDAVSDVSPRRIFTRYAGMFFLLPVMSRLGIASLLESNPDLLDCDLPARLLIHVGGRIGIEPEDSMSDALAAIHRSRSGLPGSFVQPEIWSQGIYNNGPFSVRRVEGTPTARALFDGSGRLALACWWGRRPDGVRQLAVGRSVGREAGRESRGCLELLLDSWVTAMRRWSRRYARIGLRDLVRRPGRVSVTNTHVDVVFDHRLADVRVRKAGLDLDPGWIPWFGRVVSFHYEYGESIDG